MLRIIKMQILVNVREVSALFWTLIFPLILATLFHFAFSEIVNVEQMEPIKVAVVTDKEGGMSQQSFGEYLERLDGEYLDIEEMTDEKALQMLEENKVTGIFYNGSQKSLTVGSDSIYTSILTQYLDSYLKNEAVFLQIAKEHPEKLSEAILAAQEYETVTQQVSMGRKTVDTMQPYYYALLAMTCMFGGFLGLYNTVSVQANASDLGARMASGCVKKWKSITASLISAWILNMIEMVIVLIYMTAVMRDLDVAGNVSKILLICGTGSLCSTSLGMFVGTVGTCSENMKNGILVCVSMVCTFMADLMMQGVKYTIEMYAPVINRINPAALISDAFYSVLVYDDASRYARSLAGLLALGFVLLAVTILSMRRMRYESI